MLHKDNIWINGCFDVLHMGHIKLFRRARQMGMKVIVGVDTDERIKEKKGASRPVNTLRNRMDFLLALTDVDDVFAFHSDQMLNDLIIYF